MENGKMLEVILHEVRDNRKAIRSLDDKVDRKIDIVHSRVTQEAKERSELGTEVGCLRGKISGMISRINWLYIIIGGLSITGAGAVVTFLLTKG